MLLQRGEGIPTKYINARETDLCDGLSSLSGQEIYQPSCHDRKLTDKNLISVRYFNGIGSYMYFGHNGSKCSPRSCCLLAFKEMYSCIRVLFIGEKDLWFTENI